MADKIDIRVLGFNYTKFHTEKNPKFSGELQLKSNINISSIEKEKLPLTKDEATNISFEFLADYGDLGKVEISGRMFVMLDPKSTKDLLSGWKKKQVPVELNTALLNIIVQKASLKALQLEDEMGLPPHISFPRLQPASEKK